MKKSINGENNCQTKQTKHKKIHNNNNNNDNNNKKMTLKMTTAEVVETSVTVNNVSPIQDYVHPDDQTQPTFETIMCW